MYNISNMFIQSSMNSFGTSTIAAWGVYGKIDFLFWMTINSLGIAITTFAGQNFGARQYDRVRRGVGLADNPEAIVFFPPPVQKLQRPVRGAVIHADDFHGTQRLLRQAGHAFVHVGRYVVTGDNDGNGGLHDNPDNRSLRRWYRPFLPLHADIRVL